MIRGGHGTAMWESIMHEWDLIAKNTKFSVGNGLKTGFCTDSWCDGLPLFESYRSLFIIVQNRRAFVADNWNCDQNHSGWRVLFSRNTNDWEIDPVNDLIMGLLRQSGS